MVYTNYNIKCVRCVQNISENIMYNSNVLYLSL